MKSAKGDAKSRHLSKWRERTCPGQLAGVSEHSGTDAHVVAMIIVQRPKTTGDRLQAERSWFDASRGQFSAVLE